MGWSGSTNGRNEKCIAKIPCLAASTATKDPHGVCLDGGLLVCESYKRIK
jgi:hypothetical protein